VIVLDLTRFSRKIIEGERLVELAQRGIRVWARSGEYDLTTTDGRRHFREVMVSAAAESDKISERVRGGKRRRAKRGYGNGGGADTRCQVGHRPARLAAGRPRERVPDAVIKDERHVVAECYRRILAGEQIISVIKDLNARGIAAAQGGRWYRAQLPGC